MRITRFLLPGCLLAVFAPASAAQPGEGARPRYDLVPSVRPAGAEEPQFLPSRVGMPLGRPAAAESLEEMTAPLPPGGASPAADPVGRVPVQPNACGQVLPPGSYPSPYYVDGPGCCGPMGANGRIGYEVYTYSGINIPFGDGLPEFLNAGWTIGGGARSLFFDPSHTRAWTFDLGLSYTHNWGASYDKPQEIFLRSPPQTNQFTGAVNPQPDRLVLSAIREVHRLSFNYAFGRDVWLMGSGATGSCTGTNVRVGAWLGGRYGTSHVDLIPLNEREGYSRRQNVFLGIVTGAHLTWDVPMGGWVLFGGGRVEYGHDWMNLVPPLEGNIHYVNLQLSLGIRY